MRFRTFFCRKIQNLFVQLDYSALHLFMFHGRKELYSPTLLYRKSKSFLLEKISLFVSLFREKKSCVHNDGTLCCMENQIRFLHYHGIHLSLKVALLSPLLL